MIDFNEMTKKIKALPPEQFAALEEFFGLDSDHAMVKFAEQLQDALKKVVKK